MPEPNDHNLDDEIIALIKGGQLDKANKAMISSGGVFYAFQNGYERLRSIIDVLPHEALYKYEAFLGSYCEYQAKHGLARRAKMLTKSHRIQFEKSYRFSLVELLIGIRLGDPLPETQVNEWSELELQMPFSHELSEGIYYNCMMIVFVRLNRIEYAHRFGMRALEIFKRLDNPYLQFYIYQHLSDLSVTEGNLTLARRYSTAAERFLKASGMSFGAEWELIEIVRLSIAFETGNFENIPKRAAEIRQNLISVEINTEIFLQICRIGSMSSYFLNGRKAAIEFLNDCQTDYHICHGDYSINLEVILSNINLLDGQVDQARALLDKVGGHGDYSSIGTSIIETLRGKLDPLLALDSISRADSNLRREVVSELIKASIAKSQRQTTALRRHVERAMRLAVREGLVEVFLEHREVVSRVSAKLAKGSFARGHRKLAKFSKQVDKHVRQSFRIPPILSDLNVTRQQLRVLNELASGATNKEIAQTLGLSEAAIKYHVSNLLKGFEISNRGELVEKIEKIGIFE